MQLTHTNNSLPLPFAGVVSGVGVERTNIAGAGETPDTNRLTQATADRMRRAIVDGATDPSVVRAALDALESAGVTDPRNHAHIAHAVWDWVRAHVRFRPDEETLTQDLGMDGELELLITPPVLLTMDSPAGDCDDFTMLAGAMLLSAGIPRVEVATIAADPTDPARWSHVYLMAYPIVGGVTTPTTMDCSHGQWFGWEAPQYYARKTWGAITAPAAAINVYQSQLQTTKDSIPMQLTTRPNRPGTPGAFPAGVGGVGVGAVDWGALIPQITTGTFDVLKQVTQKPGQFIQTSGGVISSQVPGATPNPGGISIMTPAGNATVGSGSGITGTTLLLGAVVIGAALLLGRR